MLCKYLGEKIGERKKEICGCKVEHKEELYIAVYQCEIFGKCTKVCWNPQKLPACLNCGYRTK